MCRECVSVGWWPIPAGQAPGTCELFPLIPHRCAFSSVSLNPGDRCAPAGHTEEPRRQGRESRRESWALVRPVPAPSARLLGGGAGVFANSTGHTAPQSASSRCNSAVISARAHAHICTHAHSSWCNTGKTQSDAEAQRTLTTRVRGNREGEGRYCQENSRLSEDVGTEVGVSPLGFQRDGE